MGVYIQTGDTIESCKKKVFDMYGRENVNIISTKSIKIGRFFGFFPKDAVELTFLVNENTTKQAQENRVKKLSQQAASQIDRLNKNQKKQVAQKTNVSPYLNEPLYTNTENDKIQQEQIETLQMMQTSISTLADRVASFTAGAGEFAGEKPNIKKLRSILEGNAFSPEYIREIISYVSKNISIDQEKDFDLIQRLALKRIAQSIKIISLKTPEIKSDTPVGLTFSLVGPTGVGKTTTVAKLCAYYFLALAKTKTRKLSVAAITIDNYRIGGWEQIQKYCLHMRLPLTVATNADELKKAVTDNKEKYDVIFIDTTGRSPSDKVKISEMFECFSGLENDVKFFLAINASTQSADLEKIMEAYSDFPYFAFIITKVDETSYFGGLISALEKSDIPIAYITTGQTVPTDIKLASKSFLLKKLIGFDNIESFVQENFAEKAGDEIVWR
ncbi:MAG: AAA family ATPase [Treponemataceae bacterium]